MREFLKTYNSSDVKSILTIFNFITRTLSPKNTNTIIPFLLIIKDQKISVDKSFFRSISFSVEKLQKKLKELKMNEITDLINFSINAETKKEEFNLKEIIFNKVTNLLLTCSFKEFENVIFNYFNKKEIKYENTELLKDLKNIKNKKDVLLNYFYFINLIKNGKRNEIIETKEDKDVLDDQRNSFNKNLEQKDHFNNNENSLKNKVIGVIDFFSKSKLDPAEFFTILYLTDENLYFLFCSVIMEKNISYMIKTLPEIQYETLSDSMIRYMVEYRPKEISKVVDLLHDNRNYLINLVKEFYHLFDIKNLELNFEEDLLICENNDEHFFIVLKNILEQNKGVEDFVKNLVNKDTQIQIDIINSFYANETYENIIIKLTRNKKSAEDLKDLLQNKFLDNNKKYNIKFTKKIFFNIMPFLEKEYILKILELYFNEESDLREFLKVLSPIDIYYNIHYFKDINNSVLASSIVHTKKDIFNEQICMFIIQKMEENVLPPLFMRTVMLSLINFPTMKKFVIDLCFRLVKYEIWSFPRLYSGFIKCLSFLKNHCAEILILMPEERIKEVLDKNEKVCHYCEAWIKNNNVKGRYAFILKNAIYGKLNKNKK